MDNIFREINKIEQQYNNPIINSRQLSEYLNLSENDIKTLVQENELQPIAKNILKFKAVDIAKYIYGFNSEKFTENVAIAIDERATQALQSSYNNIDREDFNMTILQHGEGSVYYDTKANKWKCAFYFIEPATQIKKRKIISANTQEDVMQKVINFKATIHAPVAQIIPTTVTVLTFGDVWQEYWNYWSIKKRADNTKIEREQIYQKHVLPIFKDMRIEEIKPYDVQKFLNGIAIFEDGSQRSVYSIRKIYTNLKAILTYARENGYVRKSPVYGVDVPDGKVSDKDSKYLEETKLVEHLVDLKSNSKYFMIAMMLLATGLRPEEFLVLRWSNIDMENKTIKITNAINKKYNKNENSTTKYVYEEGDTKNKGSIRTVYVGDTFIKILKDWNQYLIDSKICDKAVSLGNEDYVILNKKGSLVGYSSLIKNYHIHTEKHGTYKHKVNFYMFRHSFATYMKAVGVDTSIISSLMGHSNNSDTGKVSITESVYISILKDSYITAVEKYDLFLQQVLKKVDTIANIR